MGIENFKQEGEEFQKPEENGEGDRLSEEIMKYIDSNGEEGEVVELLPQAKSYFQDMGPEITQEILFKMSPEQKEILKDEMLKGNIMALHYFIETGEKYDAMQFMAEKDFDSDSWSQMPWENNDEYRKRVDRANQSERERKALFVRMCQELGKHTCDPVQKDCLETIGVKQMSEYPEDRKNIQGKIEDDDKYI